METPHALNRVDPEKCSPCSCGSNLPAQYVCTNRNTCSGLRQYCEYEDCSNQHDHRLRTIVNVMVEFQKKEKEFREKVNQLKLNIVDKFDDYMALVDFLSDSQTQLLKKRSDLTPENYIFLGQKSKQIEKLDAKVNQYLEQL